MIKIDKLIELNPSWLSHGGEGITYNNQPVPLTEKAAIDFDCPCGCGDRICIPIREGLGYGNVWNLIGESFDSLSLTPSIQRMSGCMLHFFITNGMITP